MFIVSYGATHFTTILFIITILKLRKQYGQSQDSNSNTVLLWPCPLSYTYQIFVGMRKGRGSMWLWWTEALYQFPKLKWNERDTVPVQNVWIIIAERLWYVFYFCSQGILIYRPKNHDSSGTLMSVLSLTASKWSRIHFLYLAYPPLIATTQFQHQIVEL